MLLARSFDELWLDGDALLTIGTFDGVHRGHHFLLEQAKQRADEHGYCLLIVTFDPCPAVVLRPSIGRYQLSSAAQKVELLRVIDPDALALLNFTPELSTLTAEEFMDALEARIGIREMWMGEDFRFGRDRAGDIKMLVERGRESHFSLHVVSRETDDKASISSSRIRDGLRSRDLETVTALLGYPFAREVASDGAAEERWLDGSRSAISCAVPPHLALPADGLYASLITGTSTQVAAVTAIRATSERDEILIASRIHVDGARTVEFISYLCSIEEYLEDPARWDDQAYARLGSWKRPAFVSAGRY